MVKWVLDLCSVQIVTLPLHICPSWNMHLAQLKIKMQIGDDSNSCLNLVNMFNFIFSLAPVGCLFCSHKFLTVENAVRHVKFSHPGWEKRQGKVLSKDGLTWSNTHLLDLIALEQSSGSDVTVNSHGLGLNNSPTKAKSLSVASSTMDMNSSQDFGHNSSTVSSTLNTNDSITIDELELDRTLPLEGEKDSPVTDSDLGQNSSTSNILNNPNWFLEMKTNFRVIFWVICIESKYILMFRNL